MTKLEAVNRVLARAGFPPVAALDTGGASMQGQVERAIDAKLDEIQRRGWYFNTRTDVELTPDANDHIQMPVINIYHIDSYGESANLNVIQQEDRLYDLDNNTDEFDDSIKVEYTFLTTWEQTPPAFQGWILAEATIEYLRQFAAGYQNERRREILREVYADRDRDMLTAQQEENDARDTNIFNTTEAQRFKGNRIQYPQAR